MGTSTTSKKAAAAPEAPVTRDDALKQTYADAQKKIRENHLEEFNQLRVDGMKALGFDWTPPPTDTEKAKATIDALIAEHPELAAVYRPLTVDEAGAGSEE